ncbi:hypothetical protein D3C76_1282780 [compost metagenome]
MLGHPVEGVDIGFFGRCGLGAGEAHHHKDKAVFGHVPDFGFALGAVANIDLLGHLLKIEAMKFCTAFQRFQLA